MGARSKSASRGAVAIKDAEVRRLQEMHMEIRKSLEARGAVFERENQHSDIRPLPALQAPPVLRRTASFIEHRESRKKDGGGTASYLTEEPSKLEKKKKEAREQAALIAAGPTPAETAAAVHARTKALIGELHRDSLEHAKRLTESYNARLVFEPRANGTRALSVTRMALRRTASLKTIKQTAQEQVLTGYVPRSEAAELAAAVARGSTEARDIRAPDLVRGRLELLDEKLAEGLLEPKRGGGGSARTPKKRQSIAHTSSGASRELHGSASRGSVGSQGSVGFAPTAATGMTRSASGPAHGSSGPSPSKKAVALGAAKSHPALSSDSASMPAVQVG